MDLLLRELEVKTTQDVTSYRRYWAELLRLGKLPHPNQLPQLKITEAPKSVFEIRDKRLITFPSLKIKFDKRGLRPAGIASGIQELSRYLLKNKRYLKILTAIHQRLLIRDQTYTEDLVLKLFLKVVRRAAKIRYHKLIEPCFVRVTDLDRYRLGFLRATDMSGHPLFGKGRKYEIRGWACTGYRWTYFYPIRVQNFVALWIRELFKSKYVTGEIL